MGRKKLTDKDTQNIVISLPKEAHELLTNLTKRKLFIPMAAGARYAVCLWIKELVPEYEIPTWVIKQVRELTEEELEREPEVEFEL